DALLFRGPAGVTDPASLVDIYTSQMNGASYGETSYPDFQSIAAADLGLRGVAASEDHAAAQVRLGDVPRVLRVAAVPAGFWDVLGMPRPAATGAVLSGDAWNALGADPAALGKTISVDGRIYSIAGVAPARFRGLHLDRVYDVWVPFDARIPRAR